MGDEEPFIRVVDGVAGSGVVTIEVSGNGRVHSMPVESPIGAWVAGFVGEGPAMWTARDAKGRQVGTGEIKPWREGWASSS